MTELKQKIFEAAKDFQLINFASITEDNKPWVRYVVGKADGSLVFRFCTSIGSRKVGQIRKNPNVHISLGAKDLETAKHFIQVEGRAEVTTNKAERESFWFDELKNYFSGPNDPNYCIIIVRPSRIEFGTMGIMTPEIWQTEG